MAFDAHPVVGYRVADRTETESAAHASVTAAPASIGVMKIAIGVFVGNLITGILGALIYFGLHS